jgi:pimeloyl-ACP methyl ester carboxylesterase
MSSPRVADRLAHRAGFEIGILQGLPFRHRYYARTQAGDELLIVFIEGDGVPWTHRGTEIAPDPTPRNPLALHLATRSAGSVLYIGRPCYFEVEDPACSTAVWTSARYSASVASSMAGAISQYTGEHGFRRLVLIGYSGGGAIALLVAPRLPGVVAVVTIAGNLDTDRWTAFHNYLPLSESLNPARQPPLPSTIEQWHLLGSRDQNVPPEIVGEFTRRVSPERIWTYESFDHVCCWVRNWPRIIERIERQLPD